MFPIEWRSPFHEQKSPSQATSPPFTAGHPALCMATSSFPWPAWWRESRKSAAPIGKDSRPGTTYWIANSPRSVLLVRRSVILCHQRRAVPLHHWLRYSSSNHFAIFLKSHVAPWAKLSGLAGVRVLAQCPIGLKSN